MIKFIALLKRKEGMSMQDFKTYYETRHSKLFTEVAPYHVSKALSYSRRYMKPEPHPIDQATAGVDYDCIMELCYPDREALDEDMALLASKEVKPFFVQDEENLFDRRYCRCYVVEEETASA